MKVKSIKWVRRFRGYFLLSTFYFLLSSCVPATTPPQLTHTPGQSITITDEAFTNAAFSLRYPRDWRVVTGAAASPPTVTLIMPGDCGLIIVSAARIDTPPTLPASCGADQSEIRRHFDDVWVIGMAGAADEGVFMTLFERVVETITTQPIQNAKETYRSKFPAPLRLRALALFFCLLSGFGFS